MKLIQRLNSLVVIGIMSLVALNANAGDSQPAKPKADQVEITGNLRTFIACNNLYHIETTYLVEPGENKFSGKKHLVFIPQQLLKNILINTKDGKISIKGTRQENVKKKMTKSQIRKAMVSYLKDGEGTIIYSNDMESIMQKIQFKNNAEGLNGEHNHGKIELVPVADDNEEVEVTIPSHIVIENIVLIR